MNVTRRGFFGLLAAGTVALAITTRLGETIAKLPTLAQYVLRGDGVSDDTEAMQAAIDGEPVVYADGVPVRWSNGQLDIRSGHYVLTDMIELRGGVRFYGSNFVIKGFAPGFRAPSASATEPARFDTCVFRTCADEVIA